MLKSIVHRFAHRVEILFDAFGRKRQSRVKDREIDAYLGYATPENVILRGRVLTRSTRQKALENQSRLTSVRQMLALFLTDEVADVEVRHGDIAVTSDEEGYFTLLLPRDRAPGWHDIPVTVAGRDTPVLLPALIPEPDAQLMAISDIDDTMMKTGAYTLAKNLWTTFTGSTLTRHIFPDAIALMQRLSDDGRNPVFYVSSSPWNLHDFLAQVFDRSKLIRGPMFLRDMGLSETKFITDGHGSHKGQSIDVILAANPDLPAVLLGDTGQKDAKIYLAAIKRHPGRVKAVVLRTPGSGIDAEDQGYIDALIDTGVPCFTGRDFTGFSDELVRMMGETHEDVFKAG